MYGEGDQNRDVAGRLIPMYRTGESGYEQVLPLVAEAESSDMSTGSTGYASTRVAMLQLGALGGCVQHTHAPM